MRMYSAVDGASEETVLLQRLSLPEISEEDRPLLVAFLTGHALNASPYVLGVSECFWRDDELFVVQRWMDLGDVRSAVSRQQPADDLVLYVFMQMVYAAKMHWGETWMWSRIRLEDVWIDSSGKTRICWSSLLLESPADWRRCVQHGEGAEEIPLEELDGLRRLFVDLAFRSVDDGESRRRVEELRRVGVRGTALQGAVSDAVCGFADILFGSGMSGDLEKCVRKMIQERLIASDPQRIFEGIARDADLKREDVPRTGMYGTREYRKGRFHVCEAVPLAEREGNRQADSQMVRRLLRAVDLQSQQIGILIGALRQTQGLDKLAESRLADLEEQVEAIVQGVESYK